MRAEPLSEAGPPATEAGLALWLDMTANSGGEAMHPSWVEHLRSRVRRIEKQAAASAILSTAPHPPSSASDRPVSILGIRPVHPGRGEPSYVEAAVMLEYILSTPVSIVRLTPEQAGELSRQLAVALAATSR